jgi:tRNA-specific 2-thiouridylase
MKIALDLGADFVATGHYCRKGTIKKDGKDIYQLLKGVDDNKDQSYFLCQLSQDQLSKSLFPIGELTKPEVREIATKLNLVTADKKDSQGLCFIGKVKLPDFLQQQLQPKEGVIVEIPEDKNYYHQTEPHFVSLNEKLQYLTRKIDYSIADGKIVGKHQGAHYFTKGQRKGLAVGGTAEPLFVIDTDVNDNVIYTGQGKEHPGLLKKALFVKEGEVHWIREDLTLKVDESLSVKARIRYRQPLQNATLHKVDGGMYVEFEEFQSAITEGQFVAWYLNEELVGSGVIS